MRNTLLATTLAALLAGSPVSQAAESASALYEKALIAHSRGDDQTALIQLKNALQDNPNHLAARVLLGQTHLALGQDAAAEKELSTAADLGADPNLTAEPLAQALLNQSKYEELLQRFEHVDLQRSAYRALLLIRGEALLALNRLNEADALFTEAAASDPVDPAPLTGRATVALRRGDLDTARRLATEAADRHPTSAQAWYLLGAIEHAALDLPGALALYRKAARLDPAHLAARTSEAGIYLDQDDIDQALQLLEQLRSDFPKDPRVAYLQAVALNRTGQTERSQAILQEAAAIIDALPPKRREQHIPSLLLGGLINYSLNQHEKAQGFLQRLLTRNPNHLGARKLLGAIQLEQGDFDAAFTTLEPAVRQSPSDFRLLTLIGKAALNTGRFASADKYLSHAISLNRDAVEARMHQAFSMLASGHESAAIDTLATVIQHEAAPLTAGLTLTTLLIKQGQPQRALDAARELQHNHPDNPVVLNLLGSMQVANNANAAARAAFEQAVSLDPEYLTAHINLARLDSAAGNFAAAEKRLQTLFKSHDQHTGLMLELGQLAERQQDIAGAQRWFKRAVALDRDGNAAIALSRFLLRHGQITAARKTAEAAEARNPKSPELQSTLASIYIADRDFTQARVVLKRLSQNSHQDTTLLAHAAELQRAAEDLDGAIWSLRKAADQAPEQLPLQVQLLRYQLEANRLDAVARDLETLQDRFPDAPELLDVQGELAMQQGDYALASRLFATALEQSPRAEWVVKGFQARSLAGEFEPALDELAAWHRAHPDADLVTQALAEAYVRAGREAEATRLFELLLERWPQNPSLLNNLAYLYHQQGRDEALELAQRAHAIAPQGPVVNDTLGWILVSQGRAAEGLPYLRTAHTRQADNPEIRYHIAAALQQLARHAEAREELQAALTTPLPFPSRDAAEALLKKLTTRADTP